MNEQSPLFYIGLMSGTSIDGIDAGLFEIHSAKAELIASHHEIYRKDVRQQILQLTQPGPNEIDLLGALDGAIGEAFAQAANTLLEKTPYSAKDIVAIGSHGQTIRHRPAGHYPFTLQIGNPNIIAEQTAITTVADLRRRDMAAGGQGAPLAPAFHRAVFFEPNESRCIINIGGIANISVLDMALEHTFGYDTGPGNILMDSWINTQKQKSYDSNGEWAATGVVDEVLLERLLRHPFLQKDYPKSTGREDFHHQWLTSELASLGEIKSENIQATLSEFTAITIANAILQHRCEAAYVCGGGAHNATLMARLADRLTPIKLATTSALGVPPDWVEAGLCAWVAHQTLNGLNANLPSVTGARHPVVLGAIYPAK